MTFESLKDRALVLAWLKRYHDHWLTKQFALDSLNAVTGCNYQHGHLSRWERGDRAPCAATQEAMRQMMRVK